MTRPLVSIILCTYNGIKFIDEQLTSIRRQSYLNLEIIISDDASTDGTFEWLEKEAVIDKRIKLYRNESNIGFNLNFNNACRKAEGNFIAFADQDDIWDEKKIEILLNELKKDDDVIMTYCLSAQFEKFNAPYLNSLKIVNPFSGNDARQFFLRNIISGHTMLFKKELLAASAPFPAEVYYDWWLVVYACSIGKIKAVPEILVWHRVHENNITGSAKPHVLFYEQTQKNLKHFISISKLSANHKQFALKLHKLYSGFPEKKFSMRLWWFLLFNSRVIFAYKKRAIPIFSYLKHSFRYARTSTVS